MRSWGGTYCLSVSLDPEYGDLWTPPSMGIAYEYVPAREYPATMISMMMS
jgi:hypothetical protein